MLRAIFIGSRNEFDEMLVDWLAQRTELVGVLWVDPELWRRSMSGRVRFLRNRVRRHGIRKTLDEMAFYAYYHAFVHRHEELELKRRVIDPLRVRHAAPRWEGASIAVTDVNSPEALAFVEEREPDLALAMCINNYFGRELRGLVEHGVFLWHEGFTPEYRGLYSPFWAVHNCDFRRIGYTLLRMNDAYDAGEVFVQGRAHEVDPFRDGHAYVGHKAIADSLPDVESFLLALEAGIAVPIDRTGVAASYYTYPGLSDLVRQRLRLRRLARVSLEA